MIELVMSEALDPRMGSQYVTRLDNALIMLPGGNEKTAIEFEALCKDFGFSNFQVVCCAYDCLSTVIKFHK